MLRDVTATRYIAPLREGGSLPGLVEADDLGLWVVKFAGAAQGRKTLVAEVICAELGRGLGLRVPEPAVVRLDPVLGLAEPDPEVQHLLKGGGPNFGVRFLSGALGFDPLGWEMTPADAGRVVWFDALVGNVDRSWRNPNLLVRRGEPWLIDHGATMIWHHHWPSARKAAARPYDATDHVLAPFRPDVRRAAAELAPRVTADLLAGITARVPDAWLDGEPGFDGPEPLRRAYAEILLRRSRTVHENLLSAPAGGHGARAAR
ncbi:MULTISPECIES: HipA family kinase [Streptomyces]|uniref:HipA-like kinase domain-containing protein n=2 Tax=Streptomyces TaxID=1883 RepID=A0A3R7I481_9ACTN|nr:MULTISPECIES: HipA family kinase [Streptomyces]KNE79815.1 hypothetical protein ADZ36_25360 [Streptomyces fradiae]OFA47828.1 hypothetical protein BEN35_19695 [Streptomyces fradiae]PQM21177.1 hypothetical protein Sfr7A_21800 [Streptomyces xinghaiensis]RKM93544.1 hypothetical protein SFRA_020350 [Streptomyces xinghaiensis]RNC71654.1 hypothetical protein DC095_022370 [Streptomyces xinghaiensis]